MKLGITAFSLPCILLALSLVPVGEAAAAESPHDKETDHIDAFDDGGPPTFALLTNPAGILLGVLGVEGDLLLGSVAAISAEGDFISYGGASGLGMTLGLPIFPQRVPFHGFFLHPRLSVMRESGVGETASLVAAGATIGWEWTLRIGLTLRVGGGAMIEHAVATEGRASLSLEGLRPMADGVLGWVF